MKRAPRTLLLAVYADSASARDAFAALHSRRFSQSALLTADENSVAIESNTLTPLARSAFCAAAFAALVAGAIFLGGPVLIALVFGVTFSGLLWIATSHLGRPWRDALQRISRWALPGESLVLLNVLPSQARDARALLRRSASPPIYVIDSGPASPQDGSTFEDSTLCLSEDDFSASVTEWARHEGPLGFTSRRETLLSYLNTSETEFEVSLHELGEAAQLEHTVTAVAEEVMDNAYLVRAHIADIRRNLPRRYGKLLPALSAHDNTLRVYRLACLLANHAEARLTREKIIEFLEAYQEVSVLRIAELWVFPLMLRLVLIQRLDRLARRVRHLQHLREAAYLWANRLINATRRGAEYVERMTRELAQQWYALDPHFIASLNEQLRGDPNALAMAQRWAEGLLRSPMSELIRTQQSEEASDRVSASNVIGSLRQLSQSDFTEIFEIVCRVEEILRLDPAEVYSKTDFRTRDICRRSVEQTARYSKTTEVEVAQLAIEAAGHNDSNRQSGHVGFHLIGDGLEALERMVQCHLPFHLRLPRIVRRHASAVYLGSTVALTMILAGVVLAIAYHFIPDRYWLLPVLGLASLFPLSDLAIQFVNAVISSSLPPTVLPKLDFEKAIPEECATLVVVPMMLSSPATLRSEIEKLEVRFFSNRERCLQFALLSDFNDAPEAHMPEDDSLLQHAIDAIEELNARHPGGRFLFFHRDRVWSQTEQLWIGRERKRGKIEELNRYLCDEQPPSENLLRAGRLAGSISYVITLDSDTQLPAGTARRLIETIAHPLNRAEIDLDESGRRFRRGGYSIIQPRISISLPASTATRFTRLFNDATGTDPYCQAVSDVYQDLFGEGIYHGKGIYDVRAFHELLDNRFPPETLLSHDLIEGAYAGVALASDIELLENFPLNYPAYSHRLHRWIRGDWQISPWIRPRVPDGSGRPVRNSLSLVNRWKIFDNLRRSLVPVGSLSLLLAAWLSGTVPTLWSLVVAAALFLPVMISPIRRLTARLRRRAYGWGTANELKRAIVLAALLPHQAWLASDAIVRVCYRRSISRRHLLEWQTAEVANLVADRHLARVLVQMFAICASVALLTSVLFWAGIVWPTLPYLALWLISPELLAFIGTQGQGKAVPLRERDQFVLRLLARRTWRFFDDLVNEENHWLPPDNYQMALRREVAQRTSPTNIGLWLTSALAACDFGYQTTDELLARLSETLRTMKGLERYEGHLSNWYDTRTLEPLAPKYVSTVDSGNLLASLWVLEQGCEDLANVKVMGPECLRGLADTLAAVAEVCGSDAAASVPLRHLRGLLEGEGGGLEVLGKVRLSRLPVEQLIETLRWSAEAGDERHYWISRLDLHATAWTRTADRYLRWLELLAGPPDKFVRAALGEQAAAARDELIKVVPSLRALAEGEPVGLRMMLDVRLQGDRLPAKVQNWLDAVEGEYLRSKAAAADTLAKLTALREAVRDFANAINMRVVYDGRRDLFAIGYRLGAPPEFSNHYDLLASECRLASLVAIAKGDVPVEHWLALGRPYRTLPSGQVLLSWGGTMFEYLMPLVYTRTYENSLLDNAWRQAVARQIEYCSSLGLPWGISESAYSAVDRNQIYQYRAFGVPGLGLKPGLEDDLVVSPYSSALALHVNPQEATKNLQELARMGLSGPLGLIEAIDFTREGRRGDRGVPIETYMAHHQAMTLLAIDNAINANVMQGRFHSDRRVKAVESLLFERIPETVSLLTDPEPSQIRPHVALDIGEPADRILREDTPIPRAHLLGNGQYSLMLTNAGGGYSRWRDFDITRWRSDTTRDHWGSFYYVRDRRTGSAWSAGYHPMAAEDKSYFARFNADKVEYVRRETGLETLMEITVSPEDDVEIRRLTFINRSSRVREIEVTSYLELALSPHAADRAHPAFSKMFVETEVLPDKKALMARRRLRAPDEPEVWAGHLVVCSNCQDNLQFETDRATFIGRGGTLQRPAALRRNLTNTVGAMLDPIFSLRQLLTVGPYEKSVMTFVTVAGDSHEAVLRLIDKYFRPDSTRRSFEMAWTHAQLEFRYLGIEADSAHWFQELASHLLFPNLRLRAPALHISRNRLGQSRLWAHGISGDLPILLVTAGDNASLGLVREALLAHTYWRLRGLPADLVILNQESPGYDQPLQYELQKLVEVHSVYTGIDKPGGVFLRKWHQIPEEELNLLFAVARATLSGNRGTLAKQVSRAAAAAQLPAPFVPRNRAEEEPSPPLPFLELPYFNGLGGFTPDGREYAIYFDPDAHTPAPWVNVMANPNFGAVVSESGPVFCWAGNSQQNRLTPWENDPVLNPPNSVFYIRDEDSGALWTPTPQPIRERDAYRARHGHGYTVFEHNSHAIEQLLTVFVPVNDSGGDPVQVQRLRLRNHSSRRRRLAIAFYAEWTLGTNREETAIHIVTNWDEPSGALMATNSYHPDFSSHVAFATLLPRATSYSGDREQFLGRNRSSASPAAMRRARLGGSTGAGLDPCAALMTTIEIDPGRQVDVIAILGEGRDEGHARDLVRRYSVAASVDAAFLQSCQWWDQTLGAFQVRTPVLSIDLLMNRWLLYQTLSCRVWARSAFYQSGGAFGFRDQLQDVLGLLYSVPQIARAHILEAAAHQFVEGDVQHWWHPGSGMGVRSRCSDDLLWLVYAVIQFVEVTGDQTLLDEAVSFLEGPHLAEGEHEKLFVAAVSSESGTIFEHCSRAVNKASARGPHGLPLIGSGDWNDGMNRIGLGGKGESVWLGWFLIDVLTRFADVCDGRAKSDDARRYRLLSGEIRDAMEAEGWDGDWYRRAFFDDGTPVGSHRNSEARIDSLPQSWAAISGAGDPERTTRALISVDKYLVRPDLRAILLFTPPFEHSTPHPGYIMGYPPGIRENGGQYTHAAIWLAMAHARRRTGSRAVELLQYLNPIEHSREPGDVLRYQVEPYAVAADVSTAPGRVGRGGWTWYTGSAAWMYRVWLEEVLGVKLRGNELIIDPVIPDAWPGYEITLQFRTSTYRITVDNKGPSPDLRDDRPPVSALPLLLVDDGAVHDIVVHSARGRDTEPREVLHNGR